MTFSKVGLRQSDCLSTLLCRRLQSIRPSGTPRMSCFVGYLATGATLFSLARPSNPEQRNHANQVASYIGHFEFVRWRSTKWGWRRNYPRRGIVPCTSTLGNGLKTTSSRDVHCPCKRACIPSSRDWLGSGIASRGLHDTGRCVCTPRPSRDLEGVGSPIRPTLSALCYSPGTNASLGEEYELQEQRKADRSPRKHCELQHR